MITHFMIPRSALLLASSAFLLLACGNGDEAQAAKSAAAAPDVEAAPQAAQETASEEAAYKTAPSGRYSLDKNHGYITFTYSHKGYSNPFLRWRNWDAVLDWNAQDPTKSLVSVTIQTADIDSGVDAFDEHLKSGDMFEVEAFPEITFVSTQITKNDDWTGVITGDLTMKGETHPVTLEVSFNKAGEGGDEGVYVIGFSGRTKILRSQWGLGYAVPFVGDEVEIIVEAEFDNGAESQ